MVYWNLAYFKQLYDQYITSGVSVRAFCHSHGIKENRFYYWIHKLKLHVTPVSRAPDRFIPLSAQKVSGLIEISAPILTSEQLPVKKQCLKLIYPNGVVVEVAEGFDWDMIKQLITLTS